MKIKSIVFLLCLIGVILCQDSSCTPPQVYDVQTKQCLKDMSACTSPKLFTQKLNTCDTQCPQDYTQDKDPQTLVLLCIEPQKPCTLPDVLSIIGQIQCIPQADSAKCPMFLVADKNSQYLCLTDCPDGFTLADDKKTCKPNDAQFSWNDHAFIKCNKGLRDVQSLTCLDTSESCKNNILKDSNSCVKTCPPGFTQFQDTTSKLNYCINNNNNNNNNNGQYNPVTCQDNQIYDQLSNSCLADESKCTEYLISDDSGNKLCWPVCPTSVQFVQSTSNGKKCAAPSGKSLKKDYAYFNCDPPKFRDVSTLSCLELKDCKSFIFYDQYLCVPSCPQGSNQTKDPEGRDACSIDNGNNNNNQMAQCKTPDFLDFKNNKCISKDAECSDYLITDSSGSQICWITCPSTFTLTKDAAGKSICQPPKEFSLANAPITTCPPPKVADISTFGCLDDSSKCTKLFFPERNQCAEFCYSGTQQVKDENGKDICVSSGQNQQCTSSQVKMFGQEYCTDPQKCKGFVLTQDDGSMMCIPQCPSPLVKGKSDKLSAQTCSPAQGKKMSDYAINNCQPPKIRDFIDGNCFDATQVSSCKGILVKQFNACLSVCPDGFMQVTNSANQLECQPKPQCKDGDIENFLDGSCIKPSQCKNYIIKVGEGKQSCIPECPSIFKVTVDNNTKVNICTPPDGKTVDSYPIGPCDQPKIRDFSSANCLSLPSECKGIFLKDIFACVSACPVGSTESKDAAGNKICAIKKPVQQVSCDSPKFLNYMSNSCISSDEECKGVILKDSSSFKVCYPACPSAWLQDKSCSVPQDYVLSKADIFNCQPPSIQSVDDLKCLVDGTSCTGSIIPEKNQCVPACPEGYQQITDSKTQQKLCVGKSDNGEVNCPQPLIQNFLKGDCINPVECDQFLIKTANGGSCIPECPSTFIKGKDDKLGVQTCTPPNNQSMESFPIVNCQSPKIRDFTSAQCLTDGSKCKIFMDKRFACLSVCPNKWTQSTNESGKIVCASPVKCVYPQILDVPTKTCLESISKCSGVFNKNTSTCEKACQDGNNTIDDPTLGVKVCIPCFFQDKNGTCFEKCPTSQIAIPSATQGKPGSCVSDVSQCKGYFTKANSSCTDKCGYGFSPVETTTPKTCIPCAQAGNCANQDIKSCTKKLSSDKAKCDDNCPPGEIALPKQDTLTYQQCQKCPSEAPYVSLDGSSCQINCDASLVIDKASNKCIASIACNGVIFTDDSKLSYCIQRCPQGYQVTTDDSTKVKSCSQCTDGKMFDQISQKCIDSCTLSDATGSFCLVSIKDCIGFISKDKSQCLSQCSDGQVQRPLEKIGQFQCLDTCDNDEFQVGMVCLKNCPKGQFGDKNSQKCVDITTCTKIYSIDKQSCVEKCPQGQYPVTEGKIKRCQICKDKISADGLSCGSGCGTNELFDFDLKSCVASDQCSAKIISSDGKSCSQNCQRGQIQSTSNGKTTCLNKITDCTQKISSDLSSCVSACAAGETALTKGANSFCVKCPFGASADGQSCKTKIGCSDSEYFDESSKTCVAACPDGKYITSSGRRCVSKCVYPDVSKSGDTTNCFANCDANQIVINGVCSSKADCSNYLTSDGQCIADCSKLNQVKNDDTKTCDKCSDDTIPRLIDGNIQCQAKSDDSSANTAAQQETMKAVMSNLATIPPEFKAEIKNQIVGISQNLEESLKQTKQSSTLSEDDKKKQMINLMSSLKDIGKSFISKIETASSADTQGQSNDKLTLGTDEFQYVAEKKKEGKVFSVSFNVNDFLGATSPDLQKDASTLDATSAANTDGTIDSLATTNQTTNPYCSSSDSAKCGSVGLFSVDATTAVGRRRLLADGSQGTYSITYSVSKDQISKTLCVSYDETTNAMSPSVSTVADTVKSTITCQFTNNSSLYYDSSCSIIDASNCSTSPTNPTNPTTTNPTFGQVLNVAWITILCLIYLI